jgi:hypothetical protein
MLLQHGDPTFGIIHGYGLGYRGWVTIEVTKSVHWVLKKLFMLGGS